MSTIKWHADGEGRCHRECEAFGGYGTPRAGCGLLDVLPWEVFNTPSPAKRSPCPFAVLADVLRLHESKPADKNERRSCCETTTTTTTTGKPMTAAQRDLIDVLLNSFMPDERKTR